MDRAHPLDVLEGPWGGGLCFGSHLSTCFVLTFVKEERTMDGEKKEDGGEMRRGSEMSALTDGDV